MESYNVRIYYYETGTQYRIYSRPVLKLSDAEKELRAQNNISRIRHKRLLKSCDEHVEYIPFTDKYEIVGSIDKAERALQVSLNRSKQNAIGILRANKWDLFITFTFNPRLVDSKNYEQVCLKAGVFLHHLKERHCPDMKYFLVPELHKDGEKYHLHGVLGNSEGLQLRVSGKVKNGRIVYNMPAWKYGWSTVTEVGHSGRVSNYISKYITKDTEGLLHGKRRYWCSHNTILPKEVCDELYIADYMSVINHLSENDAIKHVKKSYIYPCNRDIWYIET